MAEEELSIVTPDAVRDGDPAALRELAVRRGAAVVAYAERVAAPGLAMSATAEAFARFRRAVVEAEDPYALNPERTLLRTTRYATAAVAPAVPPLRARLRGGGSSGGRACALVPELLAARAEHDLGAPDADRLERHLARCAGCQAAETRFRSGERAYRDAPVQPPPPAAEAAIVHALTAVAPVRWEEGGGGAEASEHAGGASADGLTGASGVAAAGDAADADDAAPGRAGGPAQGDAPPHQPTYEFDALPPDAFDAEPPPSHRAPPPSADADRGGIAVRVVLPALILLVAVVVALAVAGAFRA